MDRLFHLFQRSQARSLAQLGTSLFGGEGDAREQLRQHARQDERPTTPEPDWTQGELQRGERDSDPAESLPTRRMGGREQVWMDLRAPPLQHTHARVND